MQNFGKGEGEGGVPGMRCLMVNDLIPGDRIITFRSRVLLAASYKFNSYNILQPSNFFKMAVVRSLDVQWNVSKRVGSIIWDHVRT